MSTTSRVHIALAYDGRMAAPKRDRPNMPKGYISTAPKGMLSWPVTEKILKGAMYVWLATTNEDGAPHLIQSWSVWVDGTLFFEGSDKTRWAKNIARDARVGFGFQTGDLAAYGDASAEIVRGPDHKSALKVARAYATKYGAKFKYRPKAADYEKGHFFRARPIKLIAFDVKKFNASAARFTF
jgi:hypothetical protein